MATLRSMLSLNWSIAQSAAIRKRDPCYGREPEPPRHPDPPALPGRNVGPQRPARPLGLAATSTVAIAHAALDTAIANYPDQRFTLRKGILVIREHNPTK